MQMIRDQIQQHSYDIRELQDQQTLRNQDGMLTPLRNESSPEPRASQYRSAENFQKIQDSLYKSLADKQKQFEKDFRLRFQEKIEQIKEEIDVINSSNSRIDGNFVDFPTVQKIEKHLKQQIERDVGNATVQAKADNGKI